MSEFQPNVPPPLPAQTDQRTWVQRNANWFIPVVIIGLFAILIVSGINVLMSWMKESGAYLASIAIVQQHPALIEALGEPIEPGDLVSGSVNYSGSSGDADISYHIRGPKGEAQVHVIAEKRAGRWQIRVHAAVLKADDRRIDLMGEAPPIDPNFGAKL